VKKLGSKEIIAQENGFPDVSWEVFFERNKVII
jgi:hypothetical protein